MKRALFLRFKSTARQFESSARRFKSTARRSTFVLIAAVLLAALPTAATASDATLRMAFANIINGPLDMLCSPYTGGYILVTNLRDIDDSAGVRVTYALPGYIWLTGVTFASGGIRTITGALESVPGVLLFPFDRDTDEMFAPVESSSAVVLDWENPIAENENWYVRYNPVATLFSIPLRFGLNYTRADY